MSLFRDLLIEKKRRRYFCELEYLESTGTQYIDTGYAFNSNTDTIELGYQNKSTLANKWLFGSYEDNANIGISSANLSQVTFWYKGNVWGAVSSQYDKEHILRYDSTGMSNDGVNLKAFTSYVGTWNLYLFALNNTGTSPNGYFGYGKIFYYKQTRNGVLIRDFIPVLDWNMTPCMYDKVSGQLFYTVGTDNFTAGREIHYVEYLEATGTQYINTGMVSTADSKVNTTFGFTTMESGSANNCAVFGGRNNTTTTTFTFFKLASGNPQYFRFDYNSQITVGTANQMTWDNSSVYRFEYDGSTAKSTNITTGQSESVSRSPGSSFTTSPILLFAVGTNTQAGQFMSGRIYRYWYTDGTNTIDLRPAIDENGVGFMFDKVQHVCYLNAGTGVFKYPARQIEYLQSTGGQYIDTGIQPTDSYGYSIRNSYTVGGGEQCAIGCMDSGNRFVGIYTSGSENAISGAWGDFVGFLPNYTWTTGTILEVKSNYKNSRQITIGDTLMKDITDIHISGTIGNTVYLFARHYGSTITTMKGKMYCAEITNGQNIVATYIPAFKDGAAGMLDKVNNVFYTNAGTGTFVCGKIIEPKYE